MSHRRFAPLAVSLVAALGVAAPAQAAAPAAHSSASAHSLSSKQKTAYRQIKSAYAHVEDIVQESATYQDEVNAQIRKNCKILRLAGLGSQVNQALGVIAKSPIEITASSDTAKAKKLNAALRVLTRAYQRNT